MHCCGRAASGDLVPTVDLLSVATIHGQIAPIVDRLLGAEGFVSVKPLQWVRSATAPIRRVFEYRQLKGGVVAPRWGYSLDFVPHLSGGKIRWHRTEKSAVLDAWVDGQGTALNLSYMYGIPGLLDGLVPRVESAVDACRSFWRPATTARQVFDQVADLRSSAAADIHTQLPIAAALCHALARREAEGRREMEHFIATRGPGEESIPELWEIFERAVMDGNSDPETGATTT